MLAVALVAAAGALTRELHEAGAVLTGVGLGLIAGVGVLAWRLSDMRAQPARPTDAAVAPVALVEALAGAIDAKLDPSGRRLARRRACATAFARVLRMAEDDVSAVETASLLLDVGQLAVPDHILSKPGPLSVEEFHKIRIHPRVSADLLHGVPFNGPVAAFVRSHHERWDGKGYPDGLAGDTIPAGARVLAVVDCFDALTSERPYRERLSREAALAVLRDEAGKSLDPAMVEDFIAHLPMLEALGAGAGSQTSLESILSARREDAALREIGQAMSAGLGVKGTAEMLAQKLQRVVAYSSTALYTYDAADSVFRCAFADGVDADLLSAIRVDASTGTFGQAVRELRAVPNGNPQSYLEQHRTGGPRTRLRASIVCPLHDEQHTLVGALAVYHVTPGCYTQDECRLFEMVARQAGPVVSHALQLARAQEDALTDDLTGLPNTRFLWMHLTQELARASRQASNLALLLLDVDNFKQINDTEGHPIGDLALRELSALLRTSVRPYDVCARYGGDEFVIMMPECGGEEAEERLQELQTRIGTMRVTLPDGRQVALSVSIGGAVFPRDGDSADSLLMAADSRMYQDKNRWRGDGAEGLPAEPYPSYVPRTTRRM
jgi:diguanylate cyclase (GGDEF)-like protein